MLQRVGEVPGGGLVVADQGGAASWFFASPGRAGRNEFYAFVDPKPTNCTRIFCVGESAMQGFPQPRQLASSAFLQAMLQDSWPSRKVEVINLGTTAIASFPVLGILTEALEFQPDLVVIYTGNNEFFGTYGVASSGRAGSRPWMLRANRLLNSLAIVQGLRRLRDGDADMERPLMEAMMAQAYIGPVGWRRPAAANNLYSNVSEMIRKCRARGVPVMVCTLPANERDLAPLGLDKLDPLPANVQQEIKSQLDLSENKLRQNDPEAAIPALQQILKLYPQHARAHFLLGTCLIRLGKEREAFPHFVAARDLDSMPWRPPSQSQEACVRAAHEQVVPVCDLLQAFRDASPGGAIGWELMDDHVHPNLRGQALIAECIVNTLTNYEARLQVSATVRASLPGWTNYARRLGSNVYDDFGVAHKMRMLFDAQFMRATNPDAFERFNRLATGIENGMSPGVRAALREWQVTQPFAGSRCPAPAAVAQLCLKQDQYKEALELYAIAQRSVPQYTSWYLEYTYYIMLCKEKLGQTLTAIERQQAQEAIEQGRFLSKHRAVNEEFSERYTGLLYLIQRQFTDAIPFLEASRQKLNGLDLAATDQALILCYLQTGQFDKATSLARAGASKAGENAARYRAIMEALPALEKSVRAKTNAANPPPG